MDSYLAWCANGIAISNSIRCCANFGSIPFRSLYSMQICPYILVIVSSKNSSFPQSTKHSPWLHEDYLLFPNWLVVTIVLQLMSNLQSIFPIFQSLLVFHRFTLDLTCGDNMLGYTLFSKIDVICHFWKDLILINILGVDLGLILKSWTLGWH